MLPKVRTFRLDALPGKKHIVVYSDDHSIDFTKHKTRFSVKFDDREPFLVFFAENLTVQDNPERPTVLHIPVQGLSAEIEVMTFSNLDFGKLKFKTT